MSPNDPTSGGGGGGGVGGGSANTRDQATADRIADRYGVTNAGLELKSAGETLARLGSVANEVRGDHRAAELLRIRQHVLELIPHLEVAGEFLQEAARKAMNDAYDQSGA